MGNKNGKLWTSDEEVSPEVLAKVWGSHLRDLCHFSPLWCLIVHALLVPTGTGYQAAGTLVTRNEEQPVQVCKLHTAPAVSHVGQRGRPHRAEENQVSYWIVYSMMFEQQKNRKVSFMGILLCKKLFLHATTHFFSIFVMFSFFNILVPPFLQ